MGYIKHEGMMFTAIDEKYLKPVHDKALELFGIPLCVSDISKPVTNGYVSFAIFPDGSKEGWDTSNYVEMCRKELIKFIRHEHCHVSWILFVLSDEQGMQRIIDGSDNVYEGI